MRKFLHILIAILAFTLAGGRFYDASAQNDLTIGTNVRPSYVMPTHGFYNGWNPSGEAIRTGSTFDLQFSVSDHSRAVYQGLGAAIHTFFAPNLLGTPATLYLFQGAPLVAFTDRLAFGYEWNLGVSAGWKNNGVVTASPLNVYINVAALFTWRINKYWDMVFGPEYTHFSNGDTTFPNGGANTINFRIGAKRHLKPTDAIRVENVFASDGLDKTFWERMSYDVSIYGGYRADRSVSEYGFRVFNEPFPVFALNINPLYNVNEYIAVGPSLDLLYDRSANLIVSEDSYFYPTFDRQMAMGISARAEIQMPVFAINIGIGYSSQLGNYTRYKDNDLNAIYGMFALKAFVTERMFLNVSYRLSSVLYSHNLMFGLGWRFGTI